MHNHRDEIWTIVSGIGKVIIDNENIQVKSGDVITIKAGSKHTVEAISNLDIVEVQLGQEISADDKEKYTLE